MIRVSCGGTASAPVGQGVDGGKGRQGAAESGARRAGPDGRPRSRDGGEGGREAGGGREADLKLGRGV